MIWRVIPWDNETIITSMLGGSKKKIDRHLTQVFFGVIIQLIY